jgi:hypothetical protein
METKAVRKYSCPPYGLSVHFVRFGIGRIILDHIIARKRHFYGFIRVFYGVVEAGQSFKPRRLWIWYI